MLPRLAWTTTALACFALAAPAAAQSADPEAAPTPALTPTDAPIDGEVSGDVKPANADGTSPIDIPPPGQPGSEISLDDWDSDDWTLVKPSVQLFELHGYFRTRGDLLRRLDFGNQSGTETQTTAGGVNAGTTNLQSRYTNAAGDAAGYTQTNMRFRLEPRINVSEKVQMVSMVDVLDNIGFGSNPSTFPFDTNNISRSTPNNFINDRQLSPITDVNAVTDSIRVKRVYARITALNEQLEFKIGRQPNHWGLGMLYNSGDCLDCDYGQNVDRIAATLRIAGLLVSPMIDWVSSGPTLAPFFRYDGQPFDGTTWDDVPEYVVRVEKLTHPDEIRETTLQGKSVLNFGLSNAFRRQSADLTATYYGDRDSSGVVQFDPAYPIQGVATTDTTTTQSRRESRNAFMYTGDAYMKLYLSHFEFNAEVSVRAGRFRDTNTSQTASLETTNIMQIGGAFELSFWPDDRRRGPQLMLRGGGASGDSWEGWGALDRADSQRGIRNNGTADRSLTNFNFSPDYHVDLLMYRRIIGTVTDSWYVAPEARYFFNDQVEGRLRSVYSQSFFRNTTPGGALPMALEFDGELHVGSPPEGEQSGLRGVLQGGIAFPFGAFDRNGGNNNNTGDNPRFAWTLQYRLYVTF